MSIVPDGDQGNDEQGAFGGGPAMADAAVTGKRTAVLGIRGDTGDGGNLAAVGAAELGERCQQENGRFSAIPLMAMIL